MERLTAGVWRIPLLGVNAYLLDTEEGAILIDAGSPWDGGSIVHALTQQGYTAGDLAAIVVTHGDFDHIGGLGRVARELEAPVYVPADEVDVVRGTQSPRPTWAGSSFAVRAGRLFEPVMARLFDGTIDIAGTLREGEPAPGGLTVIDTPGHTVGHICLLDANTSTLFGGDLLTIRGNESVAPPFVLYDEGLQQTSLDTIQAYEFERAGFGHGPPLAANAAIHLRAGIYALQATFGPNYHSSYGSHRVR